jgi:dTDP-4-dehydrorhamnose 3,5-epimerase
VAQVNVGFSPKVGTLRGLHYQSAPFGEAKLVRCSRGSVFDVVVDLRRQSSTFKKWFGASLSAEDGIMVYAPVGCAHGYVTLESDTELMYFTSHSYVPDAARGVRFNDPAFKIEWPTEITLVSQADRSWPDFQ